jgi:hypothetical protein
MVAALRPNARLVPTLYWANRASVVARNLSVARWAAAPFVPAGRSII